jgi:tRNA A-37 threonylcarbamoyl transferase component Bud32
MGAVGIRRIQRPVAQLFVSAEVPDGITFDEAWDQQSDEQRLELCRELGNEVGRMHALHFLHGDLYPRNVLVDPARTGGRSLWFIDSWAGGPTAWRNGSLRALETDFGTWLSEATPNLEGRYIETLLDAYLRSRSANGRPIVRFGRWLSSVQESRRRELRRLERQRYRLRGAAFPQAGLVLPQVPG